MNMDKWTPAGWPKNWMAAIELAIEVVEPEIEWRELSAPQRRDFRQSVNAMRKMLRSAQRAADKANVTQPPDS